MTSLKFFSHNDVLHASGMRLMKNSRIFKTGYDERGFGIFGKLKSSKIILDNPPESSRNRDLRRSIFSEFFGKIGILRKGL